MVFDQTETSITLQWQSPSGSTLTGFKVTVDPSEGTEVGPSMSGNIYTYTLVSYGLLFS